jgi:hypothetical protein
MGRSRSGNTPTGSSGPTDDDGIWSGLGRVIDEAGGFDSDQATEAARELLVHWGRTDFRTARRRAWRLTVLGIAAILAVSVAPTATGIADVILTAAFWTVVPATIGLAAIARQLRNVECPGEFLAEDGGLTYAVEITAILLGSHATRGGPTGRAIWRFVFRSAPFSPDPAPHLGSEWSTRIARPQRGSDGASQPPLSSSPPT